MSKTDADRAHEKGQRDGANSHPSGPLEELFHPQYNPPDKHKEEYDAGYKHGRDQKK